MEIHYFYQETLSYHSHLDHQYHHQLSPVLLPSQRLISYDTNLHYNEQQAQQPIVITSHDYRSESNVPPNLVNLHLVNGKTETQTK